jgi:hypothetical protein
MVLAEEDALREERKISSKSDNSGDEGLGELGLNFSVVSFWQWLTGS